MQLSKATHFSSPHACAHSFAPSPLPPRAGALQRSLSPCPGSSDGSLELLLQGREGGDFPTNVTDGALERGEG